jgi:serine/threonine protein kinase
MDGTQIGITDTLRAGHVLGDYEILSVAGTGGMGVVYKANQRSLGRVVALKVIRPEIARTPEYRGRFLREARLAASVDHPHVVSVFDVGDQQDDLFLTMQWIDGEDLKHVLQHSGRLPAERAVAITVQIAGALDAVHSVAGLVHRDVKPANVLLRDVGGSDHAYLTDFGVAKPSDAAERLTQTGWVVGTAGYLSPEQIRGGDPGPQSDLYALGCVLFEVLTGAPPFAGENDMALRWAHANDPRPLASAVLPRLGTRYDRVLMTALAIDPEERFATGKEFSAVLRAAHAGRPTAATRIIAQPHEPTAVGPHTPVRPRAHTPQPAPPPYSSYGYATPPPGYQQPSRSGSPVALIVLGLIALAGIAVGALAAAGVLSHGGPQRASSANNSPVVKSRRPSHLQRQPKVAVSATSTAPTQSVVQSSSSTSTSAAPIQNQASSAALLARMNPPSNAYSLLLPSDWSYQSATSPSGNPEDVWTGPDPHDKVEIVTSNCGSCVTANNGGPDPKAIGTPSITASTFRANKWAIGFLANTADDPYPDNGIDVVTKQGSTPTGYAQINLWLPNTQHSTATRILDSFSLYEATSS